jgi:hypothetical protein
MAIAIARSLAALRRLGMTNLFAAAYA